MNIVLATFCIALFSLTVPLTRIAAFEMPPEIISLVRLLGASGVCLIFLVHQRKWAWPPKKAWRSLIYTSIGSVIGFTTLIAFAMREVPSAHGAVALAAMPMVTAIYSLLRDRKNPGVGFWFFALSGTLLSFSFFFLGSIEKILRGDFLLFLAVLSASFGYVEGGRLSREFGGVRVMSWAVLLTLPVTIPLSLFLFLNDDYDFSLSTLSAKALFSILYLALVSQSLGMFLWFRVLARGPMEKIALVQLLQPFMTLLASMLLLNESVSLGTWGIAFLVAVCIFGAHREKEHIK